jgi:adenylate kinase family enzyme
MKERKNMKQRKLIHRYLEIYWEMFCLLEEIRQNPEKQENQSPESQKKAKARRVIAVRMLRRRLLGLARQAEIKRSPIPLEVIGRRFQLNRIEKDILAILILAQTNIGNGCSGEGKDILNTILGDGISSLFSRTVFHPGSRLMKNGFIVTESRRFSTQKNALFNSYALPFGMVQLLLGEEVRDREGVPVPLYSPDKRLLRQVSGEDGREVYDTGKSTEIDRLLEIRTPRFGFERLILPETIMGRIRETIFQARDMKKVLAKWDAGDIFQYGKGTTILLYGPPGTGKTMTAEAIAKNLGKKYGVCRFDQMINCWYGETEKNIAGFFRYARENNLVILIDECDAILSARMESIRVVSERSENRMINIFLQEMEKYEGVLILTTNLEVNLDPALERRLSLRLEFPLPDRELQVRIWKKHLPGKAPIDGNVDFEALAERFPMSGGEIKNAMLRVLQRAARLEKPISQELLEESAAEEAKSRLSKNAGKNLRIGF